MKEYSGRILIRVPPDLHQDIAECALLLNQSINQFISDSIYEKINKEKEKKDMIKNLSFHKKIINDLKVGEVRDAVIVTQHPWYMDLLAKHKIYFFNPNFGNIRPMQYLLFYETAKLEDDGLNNKNPGHIAKIGKVKEIIFNISPKDYEHIVELKSIINDKRFWDKISEWETTNVVIVDEIDNLINPLPLENKLKAKYLVNKSTNLIQLRNAKTIDDLI